jgi:hypothetical protein
VEVVLVDVEVVDVEVVDVVVDVLVLVEVLVVVDVDVVDVVVLLDVVADVLVLLIEVLVVLVVVVGLVPSMTAPMAESQAWMSVPITVASAHAPAFWTAAVSFPVFFVSHPGRVAAPFVTAFASHVSSPLPALPAALALLAGHFPVPGTSVRSWPTHVFTAASKSTAVPGQALPAFVMAAPNFVSAFERHAGSTGSALASPVA